MPRVCVKCRHVEVPNLWETRADVGKWGVGLNREGGVRTAGLFYQWGAGGGKGNYIFLFRGERREGVEGRTGDRSLVDPKFAAVVSLIFPCSRLRGARIFWSRRAVLECALLGFPCRGSPRGVEGLGEISRCERWRMRRRNWRRFSWESETGSSLRPLPWTISSRSLM